VENSAKIQKEKSLLELTLNSYQQLNELLDEFDILSEYAEQDEQLAAEALEVFERCQEALAEAEKQALLSGELDGNNAIVSINAGAGGTESCDWAHMLYRMINRYAEEKKFKCQTIDFQYGDGAGIKSATITVQGAFAYGSLKSESGVH
jgi:peptide chain release factor 2